MTPLERRLRERVVEAAGFAVLTGALLLVAVAILEPGAGRGLVPPATAAAALAMTVLLMHAFGVHRPVLDRLDTAFLVVVTGVTMGGVAVAPTVDGTALAVPGLLALLITFGFERPAWGLHGVVVVSLGAIVAARTSEGPTGIVWYAGLYLLVVALCATLADLLRGRMLVAARARADAEAAAKVTARVAALHRLDTAKVVAEAPRLLARLGLETREVALDGSATHPDASPEDDARRVRIVVPKAAAAPGEIVAVGVEPLSPRRREVARLVGRQVGAALDNATRYEHVVAAADDLVEQQRRRNEIVATLSHELRTPLTVMQGVAETLVRRGPHLAAEQRAQLLERVGSNAERLQSIIEMILGFSRLEQDGVSVAATAVDVAGSVRRTVGRLRPLLGRRPLRLDTDETAPAMVDPELLDHVIENLLSNVARHTPPETSVEVAVRRRGDRVEVSVADDGPGIPPAEVPHVTQRFYQGGEAARRRVGGVGLGLALVERILVAHGVELEIDSAPGEGARFAFSLPAADD